MMSVLATFKFIQDVTNIRPAIRLSNAEIFLSFGLTAQYVFLLINVIKSRKIFDNLQGLQSTTPLIQKFVWTKVYISNRHLFVRFACNELMYAFYDLIIVEAYYIWISVFLIPSELSCLRLYCLQKNHICSYKCECYVSFEVHCFIFPVIKDFVTK